MLGIAALCQLPLAGLPQAAVIAPVTTKKVGWRHDPEQLEARLERQRRRAFNRNRFAEIIALEAVAKKAKHKAAQLKEIRGRVAAVLAANHALRLARRARENRGDEFSLLHVRHVLEEFNSAPTENIAQIIQLAAIASRYRFEDDEEAIALLLLH